MYPIRFNENSEWLIRELTKISSETKIKIKARIKITF
jgi:hypothetical protein